MRGQLSKYTFVLGHYRLKKSPLFTWPPPPILSLIYLEILKNLNIFGCVWKRWGHRKRRCNAVKRETRDWKKFPGALFPWKTGSVLDWGHLRRGSHPRGRGRAQGRSWAVSWAAHLVESIFPSRRDLDVTLTGLSFLNLWLLLNSTHPFFRLRYAGGKSYLGKRSAHFYKNHLFVFDSKVFIILGSLLTLLQRGQREPEGWLWSHWLKGFRGHKPSTHISIPPPPTSRALREVGEVAFRLFENSAFNVHVGQGV